VPDVIAMPIVLHPTEGHNQLVIDTRDGRHAHLAWKMINPLPNSVNTVKVGMFGIGRGVSMALGIPLKVLDPLR
jgi:hypothetical protein